MRKQRSTNSIHMLLSCLGLLILITSCVGTQATSATIKPDSGTPQKGTSTEASNPTATPQAIAGHVYTDPKLGFQFIIPQNWKALAQPGSQGTPDNEGVTLLPNTLTTHAIIYLGIFQGTGMPSAFASPGQPTTTIGKYPAFNADRDTQIDQGRAPYLVRIFLASDDYVMAGWCAPNAFSHKNAFEEMLATYRPGTSTFVAHALSILEPQDCGEMQQMSGYKNASWGTQLASPDASGWRQLKNGTFICSNDNSPDWYLFQCTELANRFIEERRALPRIPGNAARYLDYYQSGSIRPGTIRTFPAGSYQISNDASQGQSSFRPIAGDLLIFQDVNNQALGWKSGLTNSPGHIAVIVGVDGNDIYVAQENYNGSAYFQALPIHKVGNGYEITDLSGWSSRIVRGWIHFTINGGALPTL